MAVFNFRGEDRVADRLEKFHAGKEQITVLPIVKVTFP